MSPHALAQTAEEPLVAAADPSATASASTTVYLPNVTRMLGGPDGWQTPFIVQNVGAVSTDLIMSFYAQSDGSLVKTRAVRGLAPGRSVSHDPNADGELPAGGFSVVVTSTGAPIVAVVNEHQRVRDAARQEALSYVGLSSGSTVVSLPYVAKQVNGWLTTMIVQNLGSGPATVTARFVSSAGTTTLARAVAPGRSSAIDPTVEPALAGGVTYAVTLTADQPIAAVVNAHNDAPGVLHPMGFSYNGVPADSATRVLIPYVADLPALSGRKSTLYIQNAGLSAATPTVTLRRLDIPDAVRVDLPSLAPGVSTPIQPSQTSAGVGEYSVEVSGGQFAVVAASTTVTSAMGYAATAEPAERLYLPNVTRTLGGSTGWTTPIVVQAASPYQPAITLRWYRFSDGALAYTQTIGDLAYGASRRIDPREVPSLTDNTQYSVVIDAPFGAAAVVNELSGAGGDGEMSYEGLPTGTGVTSSGCAPASGPAGSTFTCTFGGLPAGSAATVAVSSPYGDGVPTPDGPVAADGTLTVRRIVQIPGTRKITVRAGASTRTAELNVLPASFSVAITSFTTAALSVHTEPGLMCAPRVTLADGTVRSDGDFSPRMTNAGGDLTWYYAPLTAPLGPATANVTCAWSDLAIADERALVIGRGLYGHVSDPSGIPIAGVSMRFFQGMVLTTSLPPITTDAFGNYALSISTGSYRVQALPPLASGLSSGFSKDAIGLFGGREVTVVDTAVAADVTLHAGALLSGRLVNADKQAAGGMNVYVTASGLYVMVLTTGSDGEYSLRLPEGSYILRVYPGGGCCIGPGIMVMPISVGTQDVRAPQLQLPP